MSESLIYGGGVAAGIGPDPQTGERSPVVVFDLPTGGEAYVALTPEQADRLADDLRCAALEVRNGL